MYINEINQRQESRKRTRSWGGLLGKQTNKQQWNQANKQTAKQANKRRASRKSGKDARKGVAPPLGPNGQM